MMLRPFTLGVQKFARSAYFFACRMNLNNVVLNPTSDVRHLVLFGDGTPENYVVAILAHHLNERKVIGIAKHQERTGLDTLTDVRTYFKASKRLETLVLITDRNKETLDAITNSVKARLEKAGLEYELSDEGVVKIATLRYDEREADLIVLLNDFRLEGAKAFTIENHLLYIAIEVFGHEYVRELLDETRGDPKAAWRRLGKRKQAQVFRCMIEKREIIEQVFPQHVRVLELIDG